MEIYRIKIASFGTGWNDVRITEETTEMRGEEVKVDYSLDGDACTLTVNGGKAVQKRCGEQNVHILFEEGKTTECVFGNGGMSGSFLIFTNKIKLINSKGGFKLKLDYLSGWDREPVSLTFTALKKSWGTK